MNKITGRAAWVLLALVGLACGSGVVDPGQGPGPGSPVPVWTVDVGPQVGPLQIGSSVQLSATPKDRQGTPLGGRLVTWQSQDTSVARVSPTGLMTARAGGATTVLARSEGKTGSLDVVVLPPTEPQPRPVATVVVRPTELTLPLGASTRLEVTLLAADGSELSGRLVTWTTTDAAVVFVEQDGVVRAGIGGVAWITATSEGVHGTAKVSVSATNEAGLRTIEGQPLPYLWRTFLVTDEHGVEVTQRIKIASGGIGVNPVEGTYQLRTVQEMWEDLYVLVDGVPVVWGVQLRETRTFDDHGRVQPLHEGSGTLVFRSESNAVQTFTGHATSDGFEVEQHINGIGESLRLRFVR